MGRERRESSIVMETLLILLGFEELQCCCHLSERKGVQSCAKDDEW